MADYTPVVFEDSKGNKISNDPVYLAQQTLEAAGITYAQSQPATMQSALVNASGGAPAAPQAPSDDDEIGDDDTPDVDADGKRTYKELDGKGLKTLAAQREVDITGLKKVGEVRAALIADDEAKANQE